MSEKNKESAEIVASSMTDAEKERIRRDIYRSDMEKLKLFTRMLKQNALFKNAKVIHKNSPTNKQATNPAASFYNYHTTYKEDKAPQQ